MAALAGRYGPQGSLWAERPDLPRVPVRAWQIWNEPNLTRYWSEQPFAPSYVRLLKAADAALAAADPGATVVLAGLPNESWTALRQIYKAGGRGHFDAVALHPYTRKPRDVLRLVRYARREMRRANDGRTPVWLTELSWPAAKGKVPRPAGFETTDRGQAAKLGAALRLLVRDRAAPADPAGVLVHVAVERDRAELVRLVRAAPPARRHPGLRAGARGLPQGRAQAAGLPQGGRRAPLRGLTRLRRAPGRPRRPRSPWRST